VWHVIRDGFVSDVDFGGLLDVWVCPFRVTWLVSRGYLYVGGEKYYFVLFGLGRKAAMGVAVVRPCQE